MIYARDKWLFLLGNIASLYYGCRWWVIVKPSTLSVGKTSLYHNRIAISVSTHISPKLSSQAYDRPEAHKRKNVREHH